MEIQDLIKDYQSRFGEQLLNRRKYLSSISKKQLLQDLRNFGITEQNSKRLWSSHLKNNRWFNIYQIDKLGNKVQLRDRFIYYLNESFLLETGNKDLDFNEIFQEVTNIYQKIQSEGLKGARQMTLYDISCFIGDHLKVYPSMVYIHQGVIKGARALNLISKNSETSLSIDFVISKVPELECFKEDPDKIESFLCIEKDELAKLNYRNGNL